MDAKGAEKFPDREFAFPVLFGTIPCSESQGNSSEVPVIATNLDEMNCHREPIERIAEL
jgi:hypothetical protein